MEIDEMTLFDVQTLFAYWREFPPMHEILKAVHGIERKSGVDASKAESDPSGIGSLIARFPNGNVNSH
jgi:hypothetical protein